MSLQFLESEEFSLSGFLPPQNYIKRYEWRNSNLEDTISKFDFVYYDFLKTLSYYYRDVEYEDINRVELYTDAPRYLMLRYDEQLPVAFLGFSQGLFRSSKFKIYQLQGAKFYTNTNGEYSQRGGNEFLRGFDWRLAMLDAFEDFSKFFTSKPPLIEVISADNNVYVEINEIYGTKGLPRTRAEQIYDRTAKMQGYQQNRRRNFEKQLN